jgi:hypothetical protein
MSVQSIFTDPDKRRGSRDYNGPVLELFHENEVNIVFAQYVAQGNGGGENFAFGRLFNQHGGNIVV